MSHDISNAMPPIRVALEANSTPIRVAGKVVGYKKTLSLEAEGCGGTVEIQLPASVPEGALNAEFQRKAKLLVEQWAASVKAW